MPTLDLTQVFFWLSFTASAAVTLAFGLHWVAERWLSGKSETSDATFYAALGGIAVTAALLLSRLMPGA